MAETLDAAEMLRHTPLIERHTFKTSLRTTLIKSNEDIPTFEEAFEQFFLVEIEDQNNDSDNLPNDIDQSSEDHTDSKNHSENDENGTPDNEDKQNDTSTNEETSDSQESEDDVLKKILARINLGEQTSENATEPGVQRDKSSDTIDLYQELPSGEIENLYDAVEDLARNLVTRKSLRFKKSGHGRVDIKKTIQRSFRTGNLPFHIIHKHQKIKKNELVVLCDVSGSVWEVARFFIKLVHEMQSQFRRARSFLFVDRITEVTDNFDHNTFEEIVENFKNDHTLNFFGLSDFGRAFYQFYDEYLPSLSKNTVLVILGDARTNWFDPQDWVLDELQNRVHKMIWLNPEPQQYWNTDDSVMSTYHPYCDHVLECRNLGQLKEIGELILMT